MAKIDLRLNLIAGMVFSPCKIANDSSTQNTNLAHTQHVSDPIRWAAAPGELPRTAKYGRKLVNRSFEKLRRGGDRTEDGTTLGSEEENSNTGSRREEPVYCF